MNAAPNIEIEAQEQSQETFMKSHFDILRCPVDKSRLTHDLEKSELISENGRRYPVLEGYPCFLPEDLLPESYEHLGIRSFKDFGKTSGSSWVANHWKDCKISDLIGLPESGYNKMLCFGSGPVKEQKLLHEHL